MAVTSFIPQIWSARLIEHLDKAHVFANLVNRNYEGEISAYGDTVQINQIGDITVKDYTKNTDIASPEDLSTTNKTLTINQQKYFNFQVDDVDKAQMRASLMDPAMQRAAYALNDVADNFLADTISKAATAAITTDTALTAANVYETVVKIKVAMDKANVPKEGRWLVVPPEAEGLMLLDQRFTGTGGNLAESNLQSGMIARAAGFTIYGSNNVPFNTTGSKYTILAGVPQATTYAEQIIETKAYSPEKRFGDAVKGLHVYGSVVTNPKAVYKAVVTFA